MNKRKLTDFFESPAKPALPCSGKAQPKTAVKTIGAIDWDDCETLKEKPLVSSLWEDRAKVRTLDDLKGQDNAVKQLAAWLSAPIDKAVLLAGPSGCGKTSLARSMFESRGYRIWNEAMLGENETFADAVTTLMTRPALVGSTKRAVLIECAEGILGDERTKLLKAIKKPSIPIIITCDDAYALRTLKDACILVQMKPLDSFLSCTLLMKAANKNGVQLSKDSAETLLESSHGNVRQAMNSMQFMVSTKHRTKTGEASALQSSDHSWDLFGSTARICSGITDSTGEDIASSDLDLAMATLHHNSVASARDLNAVVSALDCMSMSDILMQRYASDMASTIAVKGVALACKGPQRVPKMQFPSLFGKMSSANSRATNLRLAAAGTPPVYQSATVAALPPFTQLQSIRPSAFDAHDYLLVRCATKQVGKFSPAVTEIFKKGAWKIQV